MTDRKPSPTPDEFNSLRHWSEFGQKGSSSTLRARSSGWQNHPFETPVTSSWRATIQRTDIPKLINGFMPRAMEDKWFIYADGPDAGGNLVVHMFRSWTGFKMAEVKIKAPVNEEGIYEEKDWEITELVWESNEERYRGQTEEAAKAMIKEACTWVLDVSLRE